MRPALCPSCYRAAVEVDADLLCCAFRVANIGEACTYDGCDAVRAEGDLARSFPGIGGAVDHPFHDATFWAGEWLSGLDRLPVIACCPDCYAKAGGANGADVRECVDGESCDAADCDGDPRAECECCRTVVTETRVFEGGARLCLPCYRA